MGERSKFGVIQNDNIYDRVVIVFTRASSLAPTYGIEGMFQRCATAGKAWCALEPSKRSLIVGIPRVNCASKTPLGQIKDAKIPEMKNLLDSLQDGTTVELISVGIDGLTTDVSSLQWLYDTYGRLELRLIVIVPTKFAGSEKSFPEAKNGIRYGRFTIEDIVDTMDGDPTTDNGTSKELLEILTLIREAKEE
jgi:hypothetical protein